MELPGRESPDPGERTTGTRDEHFDLVSVLYHALQGADACARYAFDAETVGDERLAAFFREAQAMQSQLAERAKGMLGIHTTSPEGGISPGGMSGGMPAETTRGQESNAPPTTDVPRTPPRGAPGDAQSGSPSEPSPRRNDGSSGQEPPQ